ncbi:MAG TPA: Fis family transcriptional regulator, partial [Anaeromyxobacteraceae bacterium]|nr:Fis family transcriptional regulator [Anaeromyxobacteraceae bacterium]
MRLAMGALDPELMARAIRWCADAGRRVGEAEVRAALEPLGWDELLAARALLADPPPARPLGPQALVDLARGVAPDVAAERERLGRYRAEADLERRGAPEAPRPARARRASRRGPGVV